MSWGLGPARPRGRVTMLLGTCSWQSRRHSLTGQGEQGHSRGDSPSPDGRGALGDGQAAAQGPRHPRVPTHIASAFLLAARGAWHAAPQGRSRCPRAGPALCRPLSRAPAAPPWAPTPCAPHPGTLAQGGSADADPSSVPVACDGRGEATQATRPTRGRRWGRGRRGGRVPVRVPWRGPESAHLHFHKQPLPGWPRVSRLRGSPAPQLPSRCHWAGPAHGVWGPLS